RHAVQDNDAVAQVNMVAGHADEPLDQREICWRTIHWVGVCHRLDENYDIAATGLAIVHERHPPAGGRKCDPVDDEMIPDEKSLLHRSRRNDVILREEVEDEEPHDEHRTDAGDGLKGRLCRGFFLRSGLPIRWGALLWSFVFLHGLAFEWNAADG